MATKRKNNDRGGDEIKVGDEKPYRVMAGRRWRPGSSPTSPAIRKGGRGAR
jgi:hypothetical protein